MSSGSELLAASSLVVLAARAWAWKKVVVRASDLGPWLVDQEDQAASASWI
jgi:hypothetical protein